MPTTVLLARALLNQMFQHALRTYPEECCGILIGRRSERMIEVERLVETDNIAGGDRQRSYQVCWRVLLATVRASRSGEGDIIGFYHSHPDGSARPSVADRDAAWIDYAYLVVPVHDGQCHDVTCWRIRDEGLPFDREEVRVA